MFLLLLLLLLLSFLKKELLKPILIPMKPISPPILTVIVQNSIEAKKNSHKQASNQKTSTYIRKEIT